MMAAQVQSGWLSRERLESVVLAAATALCIYVSYRLIQPFLPSLALALALAVIGHPVHIRLTRKLRRQTLAALLSTAAVVILLVVPTGFVIQRLVGEVAKGAQVIKAEVDNGGLRSKLASNPVTAPAVRFLERNVNIGDVLNRAAGTLAGITGMVISGSVRGVVQLGIAIFVLFYFFRDHRRVLAGIRNLVPLSGPEFTRVAGRIAETVHATVFGTLTVAAVQGALGGLVFAFLGLPAPIVWGFVMFLLSAVPVLGSVLVWGPAAIFLVLDGAWGRGLFLVIYGMTVIGLVDNFLYPMLVGKRMRIHPLPVFFAILGGIWLFGPSGIILGPVILATTFALFATWARRGDQEA